MEDEDTRQRFSFCFCELRYKPLGFNSWKIANIWKIQGAAIRTMEFETARIHFLGGVYAAVTIVVAWTFSPINPD